jgi:hypothetical protein
MPELELAVPDPPDTSIPMPAMPDLDLEPVVETQVDAGNVDVSVRVLSPGEDAPVTQEGAAGAVSEVHEPDITATTAPSDHASDEDATPAGGTNTNVSIRVLSPGDRGEVTQSAGGTNGGSGEEVVEAGPDSALPQPDPAPASTAPSDEVSDLSQYQPDNSRYQSGSTSAEDSWQWLWVLSLDCSGNASSTSTESGRQESLVWSWEWVWEWGCPDTDTSGSSAEAEARASPPEAAGQPGAESATGSPGSEPAGTEPWVWSWTFTFCSETRTISTSGGAGTPLTWTWDWTWTWTCPTAVAPDVQPPPTIDASPPLGTVPPAASSAAGPEGDAQLAPQAADGAAAVVLPTVWFPAFPFGIAAGAPIQAAVPSLPISIDVEIGLEVAIPPVVLPDSTAPSRPSAAIPFPAVDVAAEPTTLPASGRTTISSARPSPIQPAEAHAPSSHSQPRAHHARPVEQTRAQGRPAKRDRQQLPLEPRQSRQAVGSSSAGGIFPSALLFGFAALTGFIVLAAPGLGRRIRATRKLRPPSPDPSPIEHPG